MPTVAVEMVSKKFLLEWTDKAAAFCRKAITRSERIACLNILNGGFVSPCLCEIDAGSYR